MAAVSSQQENRETSVCEGCGDEFEHIPAIDPKYCSWECRKAETVTSTCPQCGTEFKHKEYQQRTYCSQECNYASRDAKKTSVCEYCGRDFSYYPSCSAGRFCSHQCANRFNQRSQPGDWKELYTIVDPVMNHQGPDIFAALRDAGYATVDDIREAEPSEVLEIDGVGEATLRRLGEHIDDFGGDDNRDRKPSRLKSCPACGRDLDPGEVHDHIFNCPES